MSSPMRVMPSSRSRRSSLPQTMRSNAMELCSLNVGSMALPMLVRFPPRRGSHQRGGQAKSVVCPQSFSERKANVNGCRCVRSDRVTVCRHIHVPLSGEYRTSKRLPFFGRGWRLHPYIRQAGAMQGVSLHALNVDLNRLAGPFAIPCGFSRPSQWRRPWTWTVSPRRRRRAAARYISSERLASVRRFVWFFNHCRIIVF